MSLHTGTLILTCMVYHTMVEKGNFSYFEHGLYQFVVSLKKRASKQEFKTNMFFCWLHIPICIRMPSLLSLAVEVFRKLNRTRKLRKNMFCENIGFPQRHLSHFVERPSLRRWGGGGSNLNHQLPKPGLKRLSYLDFGN